MRLTKEREAQIRRMYQNDPMDRGTGDLLAEIEALRDDLAEALALVEHPSAEQIAFLDAYAERTP